jgi:hypothetical protein
MAGQKAEMIKDGQKKGRKRGQKKEKEGKRRKKEGKRG